MNRLILCMLICISSYFIIMKLVKLIRVVARALICFFLFFFVFFLMAVLGLRFCARAFSSCGRRGATLHRSARASHSRGLSCCGAQAPDAQAQQLWLTGPAAPRACGIFPDQGSNPCPLHRQADSQPLRHQGSPRALIC